MVRTLTSPCLLAIFHPWWSKFCEPEAQGPFHQKSGFLLKCVDMIHFTVIFNVTVQMNGCMKEFLPQIVWLRIDKQITIYIQFDHKKLCQICKYMGNLPLEHSSSKWTLWWASISRSLPSISSVLSMGVSTSNSTVWPSRMTTSSPSTGIEPPPQVHGDDHTSM